MKSSKPLHGFTGSRRYTLPGALPLPHPVTAALAAGRLTHALCLEAPSPALLRDTAISLAGALLCRKGGAAMCGDCPACRKVLVGEHPDLMLYDPEENKDIYKKDSVRDLRADLYRTPVEAARKVAILQLAERLPAEGQNLLLKIIEEPPVDTFFIFTVQNRYRLLPTVLSRVTCYALPPAGAEDCLRRMRELAPGHTEEELNRALLRCGGIPETGAALLKDPAIQKRYAAAEEMLAGLAMGNGYRILAAAAPMERDRAGYTALLETLGELLANPALREMYNLPGRTAARCRAALAPLLQMCERNAHLPLVTALLAEGGKRSRANGAGGAAGPAAPPPPRASPVGFDCVETACGRPYPAHSFSPPCRPPAPKPKIPTSPM